MNAPDPASIAAAQVYIPPAGGATAADLIALQTAANAEMDARYEASRLRSMTLRSAVRDAAAALTGVVADLWGNTEGPLSLSKLLLRQHRLRGLGVLLVAAATMGLLLSLWF